VREIAKIAKLESRNEAHPETAAALASMREKVRTLIEGTAPEANPNGANQWSGFDISNPRPSQQGGTSREYRIGVLKRDAPELAERVVNGELSANAAWIEAGHGKRDTPLDTLRRAWGKATEAERAGAAGGVSDSGNSIVSDTPRAWASRNRLVFYHGRNRLLARARTLLS